MYYVMSVHGRTISAGNLCLKNTKQECSKQECLIFHDSHCMLHIYTEGHHTMQVSIANKGYSKRCYITTLVISSY